MAENENSACGLPDETAAKMAALEIDKKRQILQRAMEICYQSLEHDAMMLEKAAIVGEHPILKRHDLMEMANHLRKTLVWISGPQACPQDPMPPDSSEPSRIITPPGAA